MHPAGGVLDDRKAVQAGERIVSAWKKSQAKIPSAWARKNSPQAGPDLRGAGSIPAFFKIAHTVDGAIRRPRRASSPAIRR
jgi:hypothetical protein